MGKRVKNSARCVFCDSNSLVAMNTYKHIANICNSCGNVTHSKKNKYFLEYFIPRSLAKKWLPVKAFLRLFSDRGDFVNADFYDGAAFDNTQELAWRASEVAQIQDQLKLIDFNPSKKRILDISGGPGNIANFLAADGAEVIVTEFSQSAVDSMNSKLPTSASARVFDYNKDKIDEVVNGTFDLIMVRSSIIFCSDLDQLISLLSKMLNKKGVILIETITPSFGEIFWWQQLEYKFPVIYSKSSIEKYFEKNGFKLWVSYEDIGNYMGVKFRSYRGFSRQAFTWLIDFPMVISYFTINMFTKTVIDKSLNHKMLTQIWSKREAEDLQQMQFKQGFKNKSKTFGFSYNGYLKNAFGRKDMK